MSAPSLPAGFDFIDPALWETRNPVEEFAQLRRTAPVWWNEQPDESSGGFRDGGYWVVSRHEDIKEVSRKSDLFSSQRVEGLRAALAERAERIVHAAKRDGGGDFVEQVASELPLQAIAELLGVPQEDRRKLFDWSNQMLNYDDPEYGDAVTTDASTNASVEILGYSWNMAERRRAEPGEDIVTQLVNADLDGEALGSDEFGFFVILLAVAGNETTRNAITHGMKAFVDNPDQWELYKEQRPRTAPDEIVRWATPVTAFQRTATADTELGGQLIREGQRVGLFYS